MEHASKSAASSGGYKSLGEIADRLDVLVIGLIAAASVGSIRFGKSLVKCGAGASIEALDDEHGRRAAGAFAA
jgi:hypothetical protein